MYTIPYFAEKFGDAHRQDLLAEVTRKHVLASLPRRHHGIGPRAIGKLGALLVRLGTWLERNAQRERPMTVDI
jgi:hypothetical protein